MLSGKTPRSSFFQSPLLPQSFQELQERKFIPILESTSISHLWVSFPWIHCALKNKIPIDLVSLRGNQNIFKQSYFTYYQQVLTVEFISKIKNTLPVHKTLSSSVSGVESTTSGINKDFPKASDSQCKLWMTTMASWNNFLSPQNDKRLLIVDNFDILLLNLFMDFNLDEKDLPTLRTFLFDYLWSIPQPVVIFVSLPPIPPLLSHIESTHPLNLAKNRENGQFDILMYLLAGIVPSYNYDPLGYSLLFNIPEIGTIPSVKLEDWKIILDMIFRCDCLLHVAPHSTKVDSRSNILFYQYFDNFIRKTTVFDIIFNRN